MQETEKSTPLEYWHSDQRPNDPWVAAIALTMGFGPAAVFIFMLGFLLCDWMLSGNITLFQRILSAFVGIVLLGTAGLCVMWVVRRIRFGRYLSGSVRGTLRFLVTGAIIGCALSLSILAVLCLFVAFVPE
jgi:hypothetical protein